MCQIDPRFATLNPVHVALGTVKCKEHSNLHSWVFWCLPLHVTRYDARPAAAVLVSKCLEQTWHLKQAVSACILILDSVGWFSALK
jgi:hypothetical protein